MQVGDLVRVEKTYGRPAFVGFIIGFRGDSGLATVVRVRPISSNMLHPVKHCHPLDIEVLSCRES